MNLKLPLLAFGLSLALSGCLIGEPNRLEFVTDSRILRGRYTGTVDTRYASNTVALSADNAVLAMGAGDGRAVVQLWDAATQTLIKSMGTLNELNFFVDDVALSADGSVVASLFSNRVQLWDSRTGTQRLTLNTAKILGDCPYYCVTRFDLSSDGRYVAVGGDETQRAALFDAETGAHLSLFDLPSDWLETLAFSADGTRLAALTTDPLESASPYTFHARVWDPSSGKAVFSHSGKAALSPQLALSADGKRLAFVEGNAVRVLEVDSAREVATFELPRDFSSLALSPDGRRLGLTTFTYGETVRPATVIFDTATQTRVTGLDGVGLMGWSQDGTLALAYGDLDKGEGPTLLNAVTFDRIGSFINGQLHEGVLEATPSYIDDQHYAVSGTLELDGGVPIAFTGQVKGNESQRYLAPQARLPYPAELTLKLEEKSWTLHGFQEWKNPEGGYQQEHDWTGYIVDTSRPLSSGYATDGTLTLDRADGLR